MMKFSKILALAACALPGFLSAGKDCCQCESFCIKDFEGCYAGYTISAGGIGLVSSVAVSQSSIDKKGKGTVNFLSNSVFSPPAGEEEPFVLRSFTNSLEPCGIDGFDDCDAPSFDPSVPSTQAVIPVPSNIKFQVYLVDECNGTGVVEFTGFPLPTDKIVIDIVALKKHGKVSKYFQNTVSGTVKASIDGKGNFTTSVAATGTQFSVAERQS